ncbi:MAG: helix-turn-helix domain-containing protein [Halobacteriota archaeon]
MSEEETEIEEQGRVEQSVEEVEERVDDILESLDTNIDRLLAEALDTRARAAVYVGLRKKGEADEEAIAEQTGLYPGKVENTLESLADDGIVEETPTGWRAISPTDLVRKVPDQIGGFIDDLLQRESDEDVAADIDVD